MKRLLVVVVILACTLLATTHEAGALVNSYFYNPTPCVGSPCVRMGWSGSGNANDPDRAYTQAGSNNDALASFYCTNCFRAVVVQVQPLNVVQSHTAYGQTNGLVGITAPAGNWFTQEQHQMKFRVRSTCYFTEMTFNQSGDMIEAPIKPVVVTC
jgi:hypothetical protein